MRKRFEYRPLSASQMERVGQRVIDEAIKPRIAAAVNVDDAAAKPLSQSGKRMARYFYIKKAKGLNPVRDLTFTGRTMASLIVVSANAQHVRIGFADPQTSRIAAANQRRDPAFWFSPKDQEKIGQIVREEIERGAKLVTVISRPGETRVLSRPLYPAGSVA